jgi:hypothetical protein
LTGNKELKRRTGTQELTRRNQVESEKGGNATVIETTRLDVTMGSGSEDEDDEDKMGSSKHF